MREAQAAGKGAVTLNGRLIDIASISRRKSCSSPRGDQGQEPGRLNIRERRRGCRRRPSVAMVEIDTRVRAAASRGKPISIKNLFSHRKFFNTGALDEPDAKRRFQ